jgi:3-dehydroquinate synthase
LPIVARVESVALPAGEPTKSSGFLGDLWERFAHWQVQRDSLVLALGGGVIGDLAGFAAATFARGIRWWSLPTSLMAQVDSGLGGKVGVNLKAGKNLVGAFWQPERVIVDPDVLATLNEREFRAGLAEVVKYAVIEGPERFDELRQRRSEILSRDPNILFEMIAACCRAKAEIVQADPREQTGRRAVLNYGHTFAHALEAVTGYEQFLHGEAVAIGMDCAARLAKEFGLVDRQFILRQRHLLAMLGLPVVIPRLDERRLVEAMMLDKKNRGGKLRLVLPKGLGAIELVNDISEEQVIAVLREPMHVSEDLA